MAKPILVANWKNYPSSLGEARALLKKIARRRLLYKKTSFFIAPPFTYFESVSESIKGFGHMAAQNISSLPPGNYTGQVTPDILKSFGVKLVIVGHSERRAFGETPEHIAKKVKSALREGFTPLVCIGENAPDTDGEHFEFLRQQLKASLSGLNAKLAARISIAYEPIWAIGKSAKDSIKPSELSQTVIFLKKVLADLFGRSVSRDIPILYGGSVEPANAGALMGVSGVRGFLVGHASLRPQNLEIITKSLIQK